ncbi:T9SS type B sorting domain-containing protein [Apibacter muscae]|uniref:T9SS type B sorting domain-containing protein n=1 Tax=Apibacter muscae TaxID=2509004 RepID=UPI0011AD7E47|nr:T9SS type B sorting domain-containing protein [Apibacter muscae]TWP23700.1 T9SS type B sorting domain-containing protein [Apibacter muscae]
MRFFFSFLLSLLFSLKSLFAQEVIVPNVTINDHNGISEIINIDCAYNFYNDQPNRIKLTANYSDIRVTNDYTVASIEYNPVVDFGAGSLIHIERKDGIRDDAFSSKIPLPFKFCFYGKEYSSIVISDNGVVSFNTLYANEENPYTISGSIPNSSLPIASIFGAYHDMQLVDENKASKDLVKIYVVGTAPYRKFIINYNEIPQFSSNKKSTSQIVLYETTNVIDIYVKNKDLNSTTSKERKALIGITNATGSNGIAAPGRNTGEWEAKNEAWRFLPSGSSSISVKWYDSYNKLIGSNPTLVVNPSVDTKYKVVVTYSLCTTVTKESEIEVKFLPDFPTANNVEMDQTAIPCLNEGETAEVDLTKFQKSINSRDDLKFVYYTSLSGAENAEEKYLIADPKHFQYNSDNTTVYVRVIKEKLCYTTSTIKLRINRKPKIQDNKTFNFCNTSSNSPLTINLISDVAHQLSGFSSSTMNIKFFNNQSDAASNKNEIVNLSKYPLSSSTTLYIRVWNKSFNDSNCSNIFSVNLNLSSSLRLVDNLEKLVCFLLEGQEIEIDLTQFEQELYVNPDGNNINNIVKYYTSPIYNSSYEIKNPKSAKITLDGIVFVKITDPTTSCEGTTTIHFRADGDCDGNPGGGELAGDGEGPILCDVPEGTHEIDLIRNYFIYQLPKGLTLDDIEILDITDTNNKLVENPYTIEYTPPSYQKTFIVRYKIKDTGIITRNSFSVLLTTKLKFKEEYFNVCNYENADSKEVIISLDKEFNELYKNTNYKLLYFKSIEDIENYLKDPFNNQDLPITTIQLYSNKYVKVYVLMNYDRCSYNYEINLKLEKMDTVNLDYTICDFGGDNYEKINLKLYEDDVKKLFNGTSKDIFEIVYLNVEDPKEFEMKSSPSTISLSVRKNNGCAYKITLNFTFTTAVALPKIINLLNVCYDDTDNKTDLSLVLSEIAENTRIIFYSDEYAAEKGDENSEYYIGTYGNLNQPPLYQVKEETTIFIRVEDLTTGCFKIIPLPVIPIKIEDLSSNTISICDYEEPNIENIKIIDIKNYLIQANNFLKKETLDLQFYLNEKDANENKNEIATFIQATPTTYLYLVITDSQTGCRRLFKLNFELIPPPVIQTNKEFWVCDNASKNSNNTTLEKINLNQFNLDFITEGTENDYSFSFSYDEYFDQPVGTSGIATISSFPITLWVKVTNKKTNCYTVSPFTLKAYPSMENEFQNKFINFCADVKTQIIDLKDLAKDMVINPKNIALYTITYHYTLQEAGNNLTSTISQSLIDNGITVSDKDAFYIKFTNSTTGCFIIKRLDVVINPTPKAQVIFPYLCDDTDGKLDGKFLIEDLNDYKQFRSQIITGELESVMDKVYDFSFYRSLTDAENKQNKVNHKNFTLTESELTAPDTPGDPYFYQLWVRIDNKETGCFSLVSIMFNMNPKVNLKKEVVELTECDKVGYGNSIFNLTLAENNLTDLIDAQFSYYLSEDEARDNQAVPINNPLTYTSRITNDKEGIYTIDYIYVRIKDPKGNYCDQIAKIKLRTYPYIKITNIPEITICEFQSDGKTENTINLNDETKGLLSGLDLAIQTDLEISFHTSKENATGDISIPSSEIANYKLPIGITKIWVKFKSKTTQCYQLQEITINKLEAPKINSVNYIFCDDNLDEIYEVSLTELEHLILSNHENYDIGFYENSTDAELGNHAIDKNRLYIIPFSQFPKKLAIRVIEKNTSCVTTGTLILNTNPKINLINKEVELVGCDEDNDGFSSFDLTLVSEEISEDSDISFSYFSTLEDAQNNQNPILNFTSYINKKAIEDYVYVRVEEYPANHTRCHSLAKIKLKTYYSTNPLPAEDFICPRGKGTLDGGDYDFWEWSLNGKVISNQRYIDISETGIYTLKVSKNLNYGITCPSTFTIEIKLLREPVIMELKQGKDYITVIAQGPAPLEYSLDQIHWQDDNTFSNLSEGIYTVYVRSKANGCNSISSKGIIFGIPNVITPNGDRHNDVWRLGGLSMFNGEYSHIKIFNRYGKIVFEESSNTYFLWDGKYLGRVLPTASYWYIITIADGRKFTGWILLRNYDDIDTYK